MSLANHARGEQSKSGLNNSGSTQHNTSRKSCFHAKSTTKHTHVRLLSIIDQSFITS